MPHEILRTAQVATVLGGMSAREKRSYEAAVDAARGRLRGRWLSAGRGRWRCYPLCCRHLAYAWRMFTAYPRKKQVVIVALDKHERSHNPAADLAEVLPGLATTGRKRSAKPPCCEDAADPPAMNEELSELLSALS